MISNFSPENRIHFTINNNNVSHHFKHLVFFVFRELLFLHFYLVYWKRKFKWKISESFPFAIKFRGLNALVGVLALEEKLTFEDAQLYAKN